MTSRYSPTELARMKSHKELNELLINNYKSNFKKEDAKEESNANVGVGYYIDAFSGQPVRIVYNKDTTREYKSEGYDTLPSQIDQSSADLDIAIANAGKKPPKIYTIGTYRSKPQLAGRRTRKGTKSKKGKGTKSKKGKGTKSKKSKGTKSKKGKGKCKKH